MQKYGENSELSKHIICNHQISNNLGMWKGDIKITIKKVFDFSCTPISGILELNQFFKRQLRRSASGNALQIPLWIEISNIFFVILNYNILFCICKKRRLTNRKFRIFRYQNRCVFLGSLQMSLPDVFSLILFTTALFT